MREPLRFHPGNTGFFVGGIGGSTLIDGSVSQRPGFFAGYRFGLDYDVHWGCELCFAFSSTELAYDYVSFNQRHNASNFFWDASVLYYPWGDVRWRPYLLVGLGAARFDFLDEDSVRWTETVMAVPLAIGLKFRWHDRLALRLEFADNIAFGGQFDAVHNVSITGGIEFLFGGRQTAYWPWNPGRHYQ